MICLNAKVNLNIKLKKFLIKTEKELNNFFQIKLESPLVILLNSRKDINKIFGKKTPTWLVGFIRKNSIFILHPKVYTKESSHKSRQDFWKTLKHEYCHLYYKKITGNTCPDWLNEGLACFLAKQVKPKLNIDESLDVLKNFPVGKGDVYKIGYFWVGLLLKKFGKLRLIKLLRSFKPETSEHDFAKIFYKIYKIKFDNKGLEKIFKLKIYSK